MAESRAHILVVDDEVSLREFLTILLEKEGYTVSTAEDVGSGIAALDGGRFDLVMCDLKLPDGSGLDVLEAAHRKGLDCEFIIITAHTTRSRPCAPALPSTCPSPSTWTTSR